MLARATILLLALAAQPACAQDGGEDRGGDAGVYVQQAEPNAADRSQTSVYAPNASPRQTDRRAEPIPGSGAAQNAPLAQVNESSDDVSPLNQLTDVDRNSALAQLSDAEREVLVSAVEGTDICNRETQIAAVQELCARRLEDRSEEFATVRTRRLSPEERLLGESLDNSRIATLESALNRLARGEGLVDAQEDQAIASIALADNPLAPQTPNGEQPGESDLSLETQALINAIVDQFGGGTDGN